MRNSRLIAILLTFITLLLVLASAVVFLLERNQDLDQQKAELSADIEVIDTAKSNLESELAVLESAYASSGATREALAEEQHQTEALVSTIEAEDPAEIEAAESSVVTANQEVVELVFFAPANGAMVKPLDTITMLIAARAEEGIDRIEVTIDDDEPLNFPAGGQITFTLPIQWEVLSEGVHTISATAFGANAALSDTESIRIEAAFQSEEERDSVLRQRQVNELASLRFPEATPESSPRDTDPALEDYYHLQMLTGMEGAEDPEIISKTLVYRTLNFIPPGYQFNQYIDTVQGLQLVVSDISTISVVDVNELVVDSPLEQWIGFHNAAHDMQYDVIAIDEDDILTMDADSRLAMRALLEGEAAFLQYLYLRSDEMNAADRASIEEALEAIGTTKLDTLPIFLRREYEFGAEYGFEFARYLYENGGVEALNAAWQFPPTSTEQIIHPDLYLKNALPRYLDLQDIAAGVLTEGWRKVDDDTFGEFFLRLYLGETLSAEEAAAASSGWAGGSYALFEREEDQSTLLLLLLAWDSPGEQEEFETAFQSFMSQRMAVEGVLEEDGGLCWESGDYVCLYQRDGNSLILQFSDSNFATTYIPTIIIP
ncbi:MAG: hypothetical protein ACK2T3_08565 [Candidatus Promineifilaceae bacterium]